MSFSHSRLYHACTFAIASLLVITLHASLYFKQRTDFARFITVGHSSSQSSRFSLRCLLYLGCTLKICSIFHLPWHHTILALRRAKERSACLFGILMYDIYRLNWNYVDLNDISVALVMCSYLFLFGGLVCIQVRQPFISYFISELFHTYYCIWMTDSPVQNYSQPLYWL